MLPVPGNAPGECRDSRASRRPAHRTSRSGVWQWGLLGPPIARAVRSSRGWPTRSVPASHGVSCRDVRGPGRRSTPASAVTRSGACSPGPCSRYRPRRMPPVTSTGWSSPIPSSSGPTSTLPPPAEEGEAPAGRTGGACPRPIPRRTDNQGPPRLRRPRPRSRSSAHTGPAMPPSTSVRDRVRRLPCPVAELGG